MSNQGDRAAWLKAGGSVCARTDIAPQRPYRMVLLGAPGVGKGTQAELISERLHACQLSTGDVFRAASCDGADSLSAALKEAMESMRAGKLVSDDTVIEMVRERSHCLSCRFGFLLDGFPRTVHQAESLGEILDELDVKLDAVLNYTLPIEDVVKRLSGRRTCRSCKTTFHVEGKPPKAEGVCDKCSGELYQRDDDQPESIRTRLQAYAESTAPLAEYYEKKGLLCTISAEGDPETVFGRTTKALQERLGAAM